MRSFIVDRGHDESGVSGTGTVIEGVVFSNGRVILHWLGSPGSIVMWDTFEDFWQINVASHPSNRTTVTFDDGEILKQKEYVMMDGIAMVRNFAESPVLQTWTDNDDEAMDHHNEYRGAA